MAWAVSRSQALVALLLLLIASLSPLTAQQLTTYHMGSQPDNSLVYALPKTMLYLSLEYTHKVEEPGKLALYSQRYLGAKEPILQSSSQFQLGAVELGSYGMPDPSHRYAVKFGRRHDATDVTLSDGGLLLGINSDQASIESLPHLEHPQVTKTPVTPPKSEGAFLSLLPPTYLQATTDAKRAEIVAEEIYQIRESRTAIVSGQSEQPFTDGTAMALAVDRLDESEQMLTQLFTGERTLTPQRQLLQGIDLAHTIAAGGCEVIARFSEHYGVLDASDLRGEPIYLTAKVIEQAPELSEKEQKKLEKRLQKGIAYRVPGIVEVTITFGGKELVQQQLYVGQLGSIEVLDPALFNNRNPITEVDFYSTTGGIKELRSRERSR